MKINVGSGRDTKTGWLNVDISPKYGPDVVADVQEPWTWLDEPADIILASHIVEHLPDIGAFLQHAHDALDPAGLLVIKVPHAHHKNAITDPTHVRLMNERSLDYWIHGWPTWFPRQDSLPFREPAFELVDQRIRFAIDGKWQQVLDWLGRPTGVPFEVIWQLARFNEDRRARIEPVNAVEL